MSAATSQSIPDFYTWCFSNSPVQVRLYLDVVNSIREQIEDSQKVTGVFSGYGLLTGDMAIPGITRVLDSEPLQVPDAASAVAAASARGTVVGFYRTTSIGCTSMRDEDKALAKRSFSHPSSVFLLIETGKSSIGDARFCFWTEGELFDWPLMLFPFDAQQLALGEWRRRSSTPVTSPAEQSVEEVSQVPASGLFTVSQADHRQESTAPEPVTKRRQGTGRWWLTLGLATVVAAAVLVSAFMYFRSGSSLPVASQVAPPAGPRQAEVKTPFGLAVEKRGINLLVSWNGNAAEISKASFGMLLIRGSKVSRDVPLTIDELRAGRVVYAAPEDQVRFQLNVVAGEEVTRESLTVVMPGIPERRARLTSSQGGNSDAGEQPTPPILSGSASVRELRQFKQLENRAPATASPLRIDEPPPVGATPPHSGTLSLLNQSPVALSAPVASPAKGIPTGETPLLSAEAHPPVAINQVVPSVPAQLKGGVWTATVVDVTVSVDASGKVEKAEAGAKSGMHPLLREAALQAARRWKFQPAEFNGHPVPASIVLQFNFAASR